MKRDEKERYDRQIRLWGHSTQKCLSTCHVRFDGFFNATPEIAKNLVLSGIRSATVVDGQPVTEEDGRQNFLVRRSADGETREQAAVRSLRSLNPFVHINGGDTPEPATPIRVCVLQLAPDKSAVDKAVASIPADCNIACLCISAGDATLALFLYKKKSTSFVEQVEMLLGDPDTLEKKNAVFQRMVLRCYLGVQETSFTRRLQHCAEFVERLRLHEVTKSGIEELCGQPCPPPLSAVSTTLIGASVAQHLVRQIGAVDAPEDSETYTWMLCNTRDTFETVVGCS